MERYGDGKQSGGPKASGSRSDSGESNVNTIPRQKHRIADEEQGETTTIPPTHTPMPVRMLPFWPEEPEVWFAQIEGQFVLSNITNDSTKFYYVISQLEHQYASEVKDIIVSPPPSNKYEKLKEELVKRLTTSKERKIKQLLLHEDLGDRKPSQFLRHLQGLAGGTVSTELMRTIWASRLPSNLQTIVALQKDHPLEAVADLADHVQDIAPPSVAQVAIPITDLPGTALSTLTERVAELTRQVESLRLSQQRQPRFQNGNYKNRSRSSSRTRSPPEDHPHCWYHYRFGRKARRCVSPCSFNAGNDKGSR